MPKGAAARALKSKIAKMLRSKAFKMEGPDAQATFTRYTEKEIDERLKRLGLEKVLNQIPNSRLKNISSVTATHPMDLGSLGIYVREKRKLSLNPDYLMSGEPKEVRRVIAHELYHHIRSVKTPYPRGKEEVFAGKFSKRLVPSAAEVKQKALKKLFKADKKLYRFGSSGWEDRFSPSLQKEVDGDIIRETGEVLGSYYAKKAKDIRPLLDLGDVGGGLRPNIEAVPLPRARYKKFSEGEWRAIIKETPDTLKLTQKLKKQYDLIEFPDVVANQPHITQVVQLNPKKVIRKTREATKKGFKDSYKVFGAIGVGSLAEMKKQAYESVFGENP